MNKEERKEYQKSYNEKNKERIRLRRKQFYRENRERLISIGKNYNKTHSEEIRKYQRVYYRSKCYGIGKAGIDEMLRSQNNKCGICGVTFDLSIKNLSPHVDHNHSTGKVRSLLCMQCNLGIGNFRENPEFMVKAAEYLKYQA